MEKLSNPEIENNLAKLNSAWIIKDNFLHREFLFTDFVKAFSFMTAVALHAEKLAHHPNWNNVFNKVTIDINTHDAGGLTEKDFGLAEVIDQLI